MANVLPVFDKMWTKYKEFVMTHAEDLDVIETCLRAAAYILERKFHDPALVGELLLASLELLRFVHDVVLRKALRVTPVIINKSNKSLMRQLLNVLFYTEAFIEVMAKRLWGEYGKWVVVVAMQVTKSVIRFLLLWEYNVGLQNFPPITRLDRKAIKENNNTCTCADCANRGILSHNHFASKGYCTAPRSTEITTPLSRQRLYAESLYICKPLLHLLSMSVFGPKSWKPWLVSCGADVVSLYGMGDTADLSKVERQEMKHRSLRLVMYLLRSPFYDTFTRRRVTRMLESIASTLPGASLITDIIYDYMVYTQDKYSYMWTY